MGPQLRGPQPWNGTLAGCVVVGLWLPAWAAPCWGAVPGWLCRGWGSGEPARGAVPLVGCVVVGVRLRVWPRPSVGRGSGVRGGVRLGLGALWALVCGHSWNWPRFALGFGGRWDMVGGWAGRVACFGGSLREGGGRCVCGYVNRPRRLRIRQTSAEGNEGTPVGG